MGVFKAEDIYKLLICFLLSACYSVHAMESSLVENPELELVGPPLRHLDKLHHDLKFLQFIDHKLFVESHETWRHYDRREAGSVGRLFMATAVAAELLISNTKKPFLVDI